MPICPFCGNEFAAARMEIGKNYCMKPECVKQGMGDTRLVEVGYGKSGVDLRPAGSVNPEDLKNTGNRGR